MTARIGGLSRALRIGLATVCDAARMGEWAQGRALDVSKVDLARLVNIGLVERRKCKRTGTSSYRPTPAGLEILETQA